MEEFSPSRTALGAAMHRAAHQFLDAPLILDDPLALRIIGRDAERGLRDGSARQVQSQSFAMRAFLVVRSRFTEDGFSDAYMRGVRQYVVLGAGLDTFAYRSAAKYPDVAFFEVDHPATQTWKRKRLAEEGISIPHRVTYAPVDFERETLRDGLALAHFDFSEPAFFAWLGVVPYLTRDAVIDTLKLVATMKAGSEIVFDYPELRKGSEPDGIDELAQRVAAIGEPLLSRFDPAALAHELRDLGFSKVDDFGAAALNMRYLDARDDGLRLKGRGHIMRAQV